MSEFFFDSDFWSLSSDRLQHKAISALSSRSQTYDLDGRIISSIMCAMQASSSNVVRRLACKIFIDIISRRNSGVSFPADWLQSLQSKELQTLLDFQQKTLPRHQNSSISKYPSYPFELEDIESFYCSYMQTPRPSVRISKKHRIATLGSCSTVNIAKYLSASGFQASPFELGELVNNTYTNLFILQNEVELVSAWAQLQPAMADGIRRFKAC